MSIQTRRKSKRHELDASKQIKVHVIRTEESEHLEPSEKKHPAQIVDISLNGFKISAEAAFEFQEKIVIEFPRRNEESIKASAQVRWVQPNPEGNSWSAGCLLSDSFPPDYIDEISQEGILNRRDSNRLPTSQMAVGRWELSQSDQQMKIVDVSAKGIGLMVEEEVEIGKRIRIRVNDDISITARSLWQKQVEGGYKIGCEVLEGSPYSIVQSVVAEAGASENRDNRYQTLTFCGLSFLLVLLLRGLFF